MRGPVCFGVLCLMTWLFPSYLAAEPTHFAVNSTGGNCLGCRWIQASGEVTDDSATAFTGLRKVF
jgi:hypothetical protein